jgi:hypothetical protein
MNAVKASPEIDPTIANMSVYVHRRFQPAPLEVTKHPARGLDELRGGKMGLTGLGSCHELVS